MVIYLTTSPRNCPKVVFSGWQRQTHSHGGVLPPSDRRSKLSITSIAKRCPQDFLDYNAPVADTIHHCNSPRRFLIVRFPSTASNCAPFLAELGKDPRMYDARNLRQFVCRVATPNGRLAATKEHLPFACFLGVLIAQARCPGQTLRVTSYSRPLATLHFRSLLTIQSG